VQKKRAGLQVGKREGQYRLSEGTKTVRKIRWTKGERARGDVSGGGCVAKEQKNEQKNCPVLRGGSKAKRRRGSHEGTVSSAWEKEKARLQGGRKSQLCPEELERSAGGEAT